MSTPGTSTENKSNYIATYGSLRKGEHNYDYYKQLFGEDLKYIKTTVVNGFELFSLGSYPGVKKGNNPLTVDIMLCSDECKHSLDRMEIGAGYEILPLSIDGINADLYLYKHYNNQPILEHGDWSKRKK